MKCPRAHELIHAFVDGVISPPHRHALNTHLAGCAGCRRELETTRALVSLMSDAPRRRLSEDFDHALNARLARLGSRRSPWPIWDRLWQMNGWRLRPALVPVAAALAAVVAFQTLPQAGNRDGALLPESSAYVAQALRYHEEATRWRGLPEQAVDFNVQVSSAATAVADLIQ
jgi:anti-sigma factor RsiW